MYLYSGGSRGGASGARPPLSFGPNWGSEGRKNFSGRLPPPYLRVWMTSPPLSHGLDPALHAHVQQTQRSEQRVFITTRFHCNRNFALWTFRQYEFSPWRNFAGANFFSDENSAKWNSFSVDAKFRQDDSEISFDSTKIRERFDEISSNFRESKERKTPNLVLHSISFAQYCTRNIFLPLIYRSTCYTLNNVISFEFK